MIGGHNQDSLGFIPTSRIPNAIETPIGVSASALTAKVTPAVANDSRISLPRCPTTTMMCPTPAARRLAMELSITVWAPKERSGLNAPMRRERPAASRMAATRFTSSLFRCRPAVPKAQCDCLRGPSPSQTCRSRNLRRSWDQPRHLPRAAAQAALKVGDAIVDHEGLLAGLEVFRSLGEGVPGGGSIGGPRVVAPMKHPTPAFRLDTQMSSIPRSQLFRIFALKKTPPMPVTRFII